MLDLKMLDAHSAGGFFMMTPQFNQFTIAYLNKILNWQDMKKSYNYIKTPLHAIDTFDSVFKHHT